MAPTTSSPALAASWLLPSGRAARWTFFVLVAVAALLRARFCALPPANTGDVLRHLAYGVGVGAHGIAFAGEPLAEIAPGFAWVGWSRNPYNYPPVALFFFVLVAAVHASPLAVKIALTLVDAGNALMTARLTRDPWCGLCVWAAPMGIWWATREAQFEGLQSLVALAALLALERRLFFAAAAMLALAVQTKITAAPLLLFAAWQVFRGELSPGCSRARAVAELLAGFAAGCLPTLVALAHYPAVSSVLRYSAPMRINAFHWNPFSRELVRGLPWFVLAWQQIAAWALVVLLAIAASRRRAIAAVLPAILFLLLMRTHTHVLFWYWLAMVPMLAIVPDARLRRWLFVAWALLEGYCATEIVAGPYSSRVPDHFFAPGIGAAIQPDDLDPAARPRWGPSALPLPSAP